MQLTSESNPSKGEDLVADVSRSRTESSAGQPSFISDHEGLCSLPLEVDDDFITAQGSFPQPANKTSVMIGFVAVSKLFKVMSETLFRHRAYQNRFSYDWEGAQGADLDERVRVESAWITRAHDRIKEVLDGLPQDLAVQRADQAAPNNSLDPDLGAIFGMQLANCLITAASVQFALVSLFAITLRISQLIMRNPVV